MRVLWLDAEQNPWTDENGFTILEEYGLHVDRVFSAREAKSKAQAGNFDLLVLCAEANGALELLAEARRTLRKQGKKIILCSWKMSRDDFKTHSKSGSSAHRYARLPMPVEAFLSVASELLECRVDDLKTERVPKEESVPVEAIDLLEEVSAPVASHLELPRAVSSEDAEVLRKYLHMREEQLDLVNSEREELQRDNRRLQKELQEIRHRLRDTKHERDQFERKSKQAETERASFEERLAEEQARIATELKDEREKLKLIESRLKESEERNEELKMRVRKDVRKIRANERELEARMEILRKDSETLLVAREQKLLEQQRKIDALEFDLDQIQDNRVRAEMESERYLAKLSRVARALHLAVAVLEEDAAPDEELDQMEEEIPAVNFALKENKVETPEPTASEAITEAFVPSMQTVAPTAAMAVQATEPEMKPEDLYASLAADGDPTRVVQVEDLELMTFSDSSNKQASG